MRSEALFEDREEYWQLPPQEGSVGDWQEAALDMEEEEMGSMCFIFSDTLNSKFQDFFRDEMNCGFKVFCLLPCEECLTFNRYSISSFFLSFGLFIHLLLHHMINALFPFIFFRFFQI